MATETRWMNHARHMLWKWRSAPEINPLICQYKGSSSYGYIYRETLTRSTLLTCTTNGAAKPRPSVNGTPPAPKISTCAWPLAGVGTKNNIHTLLSCVHCMPILYISIDFETFFFRIFFRLFLSSWTPWGALNVFTWKSRLALTTLPVLQHFATHSTVTNFKVPFSAFLLSSCHPALRRGRLFCFGHIYRCSI